MGEYSDDLAKFLPKKTRIFWRKYPSMTGSQASAPLDASRRRTDAGFSPCVITRLTIERPGLFPSKNPVKGSCMCALTKAHATSSIVFERTTVKHVNTSCGT